MKEARRTEGLAENKVVVLEVLAVLVVGLELTCAHTWRRRRRDQQETVCVVCVVSCWMWIDLRTLQAELVPGKRGQQIEVLGDVADTVEDLPLDGHVQSCSANAPHHPHETERRREVGVVRTRQRRRSEEHIGRERWR